MILTALCDFAVLCRVFPCASPAEVRASLPTNTDVVAFQCRNPVHRAHYELFTRALHAPNVRPGAVCLVHPTCGPTQVRKGGWLQLAVKEEGVWMGRQRPGCTYQMSFGRGCCNKSVLGKELERLTCLWDVGRFLMVR